MSIACDTARRDESAINDAKDQTVGTAGVGNGDRNFVEDSLDSGMAEIEISQLAQDRAASNEVKQFAQMVIRDHTKAGEELKQIAQEHSISATGALAEERRDLMQKLSDLRGAEFDRQYLDAMVSSHQDAVDHLQSRASEDRFGENKGEVRPESSDDPVERSLDQWAANTLPTVRHHLHLDEAKRIEEALDSRQTTRR